MLKEKIKETTVKENNLMKMKEVIFFVYGTLKQGFYNHKRLEKNTVEYLGDFITEEKYTMLNCGGYPAVVKDGKNKIIGELYKTSDSSVIASVCALEGFNGIIDDNNNDFYDVTTLDTPFGEAYMFIFKENKYNLPIIDSGYWVYKK